MPRQTTERVTSINVADAVSKPEKSVIVAHPVDVPMPSQHGGEMAALLSGLSQFNDKLNTYVWNEADRDIEQGVKTAANGAPLGEDKNEWFKHGYMLMSGRTAGAQDASKMVSEYQTAFDKNGGDIEKFIGTKFADSSKGIGDKSYLSGYSEAFAKHADELRTHHAAFQREQLLESHKANLLVQVDQTLRAKVDKGQPVALADFDGVKSEFKKLFGTSGKDFNELLFDSVKSVGDTGNYQVYSMFKRKNADGTYGDKNTDGTPGMYNIPKWREKIDAAELHSQNQYLTNQQRIHTLAKQAREDKQNEALYGVFEQLYNGDEKAAQQAFDTHVRSGLFSRADELVHWQETFRKVGNRELRSDENTKMTEALAGVVTGQLGVRDILKLELPPKETRQLLSEWRSKAAADRSLEAQGFSAEQRPFHTFQYKSMDDNIEKQLAPIQDFLGKFTGKNEFINAARAQAKLELVEWVRKNGVKDENLLRSKTVEIIERHQKRIDAQGNELIDRAAKQLRYSTMQDAVDAAKRGDLGPVDLALHIQYFENKLKGKGPNGK